MICRVRCAWCGKNLGKKEYPLSSGDTIEEPITHSMCAECFEKALDGTLSDPTDINNSNE